MVAQMREIMDADMGYLPAHLLVHFAPKLPRIGLFRRIRKPACTAMLVFAGNLTVVTSITLIEIKNKYFHAHLRFR